AATTPLRPTVTRFPARLIEPSTRPSMYRDSEPVTSPLITRDFPMVAWSAVEVATGRAIAGAGSLTAGALGTEAVGRSGSPGRGGVVMGWFVGFHMGKFLSFCFGINGQTRISVTNRNCTPLNMIRAVEISVYMEVSLT